MASSSLICRYFHSRRGCIRGRRCQYDHCGVPSEVPCGFFGTSLGCKYGEKCKFWHEIQDDILALDELDDFVEDTDSDVSIKEEPIVVMPGKARVVWRIDTTRRPSKRMKLEPSHIVVHDIKAFDTAVTAADEVKYSALMQSVSETTSTTLPE
ncbi:hypothetical protein AC1031_008496 [Aphanomyces cochlioides]|nr:hypothetical protein AC1031_008496 [Aphanomyces cochlioides]